MEFKNVEQLPAEVKKRCIPYLQKFVELYPGEIRSAAIYGSATGQNYIPGKSDINSVIIMDEVGFSHLNRALAVIAWGKKQRITAPLLLTKEYIHSSSDVFPIEFLDIKENHILVYGEDFFTQLQIDRANLRLFCEHQIKGKLVRIRQAYLESGLKAPATETLLKESMNSLIPIFRNLLRLKGRVVEVDKIKVLDSLCEGFRLDAKVFQSIYTYRTHNQKMSLQVAQEFIEKYLQQLEKLATAVDQL